MKGVLWKVAKRLSYIQDARCLKVKLHPTKLHFLSFGLTIMYDVRSTYAATLHTFATGC